MPATTYPPVPNNVVGENGKVSREWLQFFLSLANTVTTMQSDIATLQADVVALTPVSASWTPVVTIGGVTTGITYALRSGTVTRFVDRVVADAQISLSSKGGLTGAVAVEGLPGAAVTIGSAQVSVYEGVSLPVGAVGLSGYLLTTSAIVNLVSHTGTGSPALDGADITDSFGVILSIAYAV